MHVKYIVQVKRELLSIPEAACHYGMNKEILYRLVKKGVIRAKQMGRRYMVYWKDIKTYLIEENKRLSGER